MVAFINAAFNFKNIFSTNGYFMIVHTLLQIYSLHQTNRLITTTIKYDLFVYLFAPIVHHLKESDFQNFRLENGIRLWQGMWEYKALGPECFIAPVKPKARNLFIGVLVYENLPNFFLEEWKYVIYFQ